MIEAKKIMEGCFWVKTGKETLLFGSPSEIVKVFKMRKEPMPVKIILPSVFYYGGILQANLEFPLYYFLFENKGYFRGEKIVIMGTEEQTRRMKELLSLVLLGPSKELMESWGIHPDVISQQIKVSKSLSLKKSDGTVAQIDDMVEFITFKDGVAKVGEVEIRITEKNIFTIVHGGESIPVDLNFYGHQHPPILIEPVNYRVERSTFGAFPLSKCTTGFDYTGYTTGFILWINSMAIMVDGVPWIKEHFRARSTSSSEIRAHIISHIHEDHSSVMEYIINGQRVNIITVREIFRSFVRKLSLILGWSEHKVEEMINFTEVTPGIPYYWYGAKFTFFHTVHPVSTIGFEVQMGDKKIVYSGDTAWGSNLKKLLNEGVISQELYEAVNRIPRIEADLIIMDGGGGPIHPDPVELNKELAWNQKKNMFLTHRSSIPEGVSDLRTITPGQQWILIPAKEISIGNVNAILNTPIFKEVREEWVNTIISRGNLIDISSGDTVLKEGLPGKNFYIVINGAFSVIVDDQEVAKLGFGDFFGEISIMNNFNCTATVKATCNSRVLEIPKGIFLEMIYTTGLSEKLRKIHRIRPIMMQCGWVRETDLSPQTVNRIISVVEERYYKAGDKIIIQDEVGNEFFLIRDGRVKVILEKNGLEPVDIATLFRGQSFGEMALLGNGKRSASVIAETDVNLLVFDGADFKKLIDEVPSLLYTFGIMAEERRKEL